MLLFDAVGLVISLLLIPYILRAWRAKGPHDRGLDLHHIHETPVPRLGGLAFVAPFVLAECALLVLFIGDDEKTNTVLVILLSSLAMFGLGLWDDLRRLGAGKKLLGQIALAAAVWLLGIRIDEFTVPFAGTSVHLGLWGLPVTVLWLVALTNLINLIDGLDGLAGGISFMLMLLLSYQSAGALQQHLVTAGLAGALLGFLWYNLPPARIFMGDGGAYFLGFFIGLMTIVTSHKGTVVAALVCPLFVLAVPIVDTGLAIGRRALQGLPISRPDRKHIHHRLIEMGFSREKAVLGIYGVTLGFLVLGFAGSYSGGKLVPLLAGMVVLALLLLGGQFRFSRPWFALDKTLGKCLGMRREIQFSQHLGGWLELEADRAASPDALWADFVFMAQKLGFASAKFTLAGAERTWAHPEARPPYHAIEHKLHGGRSGVLELRACRAPEGPPAGADGRGARPEAAERWPHLENAELFEIQSELLAEAWLKALRRWETRHQSPLRFGNDANSLEPGAIGVQEPKAIAKG
jgi:UDP-GlcNAc:undecaprenyl-phosphate GlcNAc-1-phosphate transferase